MLPLQQPCRQGVLLEQETVAEQTTLVGFCYLFKREVFDKVGFLDEQFSPGNFEDDDYSLRILQQGWDLLLCHDTFIHHFGHASFSKGYGDQEAAEKARRSNALIERNAALFLKKWHVPEMYKVMAVEEIRRLLQSRVGADEAVHERHLPREKKIAVLLRDSHTGQHEVCLEALKNVKWPDGYEVEVFTIDAQKPYAAQVNEVLADIVAKVKIYINDDLFLVHAQAIEELLKIFQDESIGMVGFLGSASLPVSGNLMDSPYKYGAVYVPTEEDFSEMRFGTAVQAAADVRYILPSFFATQWDVPWDESYEKQYYAVLAYCRAFEEEGYRIVVPLSENIWCAYQVKNISFDASEADQKKFFTSYHTYLDGTGSKESSTLYACGEGSTIPSWQEFSFPEGIAVGRETHIHKTALCRLVRPNFAGKPRIIVGDYCEIGIGSTLEAVNCIELENAVSVAENVHIKDYVLDESGVGISTADRELLTEEGGIHVERGVRIEENVLIRGAVRIGRGSIVRAGSCVQQDIPPYCIAEGAPARVIRAFSPQEGKWLSVAGEKKLKNLLARRENTPPLLSIAFITYNRSKYLKRSLKSVLQQLGNDVLAEILISDNASTDDTWAFVEGLQKKYKNLRYHCNEENVGTEENKHRAIQVSRGEYVLVAGDDDYFVDGSLLVLLTQLVRHRGAALCYLGQGDEALRVYEGCGPLEYLRQVSFFMTWITGVVMRRDLYALISEPKKYDHTRLPQVYLQMEILKRKGDFVILHGKFFAEGTGDCQPDGYEFGEIFIKNYFNILQEVVDIPPAQLSQEKKWVMDRLIIPRCRKVKEEQIHLSLDRLLDIVRDYYGEEPYYEEICKKLEDVLKERQS